MDPEHVRETVWRAKPALARLARERGGEPLLAYFTASAPRHSAAPAGRKTELLETVSRRVKETLGEEVAPGVAAQLAAQYFVSTADHHGPLAHPFFLNANLAQSAANRAAGFAHTIIFACGGVSMNNSSFPRGQFFHIRDSHALDPRDGGFREERLHLVSLKHRHAPVYGFPAYTADDVGRALRTLRVEKADELVATVEEVYGAAPALRRALYSEQATYTNWLLWKKIPGERAHNLIYLAQEDIVRDLLLAHHLDSSRPTFLTRLLADPRLHALFVKHFDGIQGAFSSKDNFVHSENNSTRGEDRRMAHRSGAHRGTVFFWGIVDGMRLPLAIEDGRLAIRGASFAIALEPDALREALENRSLMPSMALSFIVLSFYYGLACAGGFSQINYLPELQLAYLNLLRDAGAGDEDARTAASVATDCFRGEFGLAALGKDRGAPQFAAEAAPARSARESAAPDAAGTGVLATTFDMVRYQNVDTASRLCAVMESLALGDAISAMMPEYYKIITGVRVADARTEHAFRIPRPVIFA